MPSNPVIMPFSLALRTDGPENILLGHGLATALIAGAKLGIETQGRNWRPAVDGSDAMPVHTHENKLNVLAMIFEARYDEGFRFLDRSGELLVRIRRHNPLWAVGAVSQRAVGLIHPEHRLNLSIGVEKLDVATTEKLSVSDAEKRARPLGDAAEKFYQLTLEVLDSPRTLRVGARFVFLAPSDNLEEADRFMWKAGASPLMDAVAAKTKSHVNEAQVVYVLDDPESAYRRRVTLYSIILEQKPGDPPFLGLPGDSGSGGIAVDIDVYTRPEESHLAKADLFVQESFLKARSQATGILGWMADQQK